MQKIYSKDTNDSELEIYSLSFGQFGSEQVTSWSEDEVHLIPFDVSLHLNGKIVKAIFREIQTTSARPLDCTDFLSHVLLGCDPLEDRKTEMAPLWSPQNSQFGFYCRMISGNLTSQRSDSIMVAKWYRRSVMAALLIKNIPRELHEWLKREAERNRRSMTQQTIVVLEERMRRFRPVKFPPPVQTRTVLTAEFIDRAKREGRV